ncbi:N-acetylneuraminate epimerase [Novipirellula galeiformis]|uniref:N-acetylneuraminate epimerase n=1 Tax=Novipirellula galeiformis TaxID=2528004 RepID=A0A5C6BZT5_9BACT|nr:kelch repeat-containing protein [Novipirellula galeiformis]TWU17372.1 N-acetylneuraminate epimerase [Novipirellula galeiformis]
MKTIQNIAIATLFTFVSLFGTLHAEAHFPWLAVDGEGKPVLFFGEDLSDRTYPFPDSMREFKIQQRDKAGQSQRFEMKPVSTETLVGLKASESAKSEGSLYGTQPYGIYHGSKLVYFVQHFPGSGPSTWIDSASDSMLRASITPHGDGIRVAVHWNDQPLTNVEVKLFCREGHQEAAAKTSEQGVVTFTGDELEAGLNAVMVGFTDSGASGTFESVPFQATSNYLTATFNWPDQSSDSGSGDSGSSDSGSSDSGSSPKVAKPSSMTKADFSVNVHPSSLPDLPLELTSFGGAIAKGTLFVYGGHTGNAHSYSTAEQSDALWSLDLQGGKEWVSLPSGPRLQGLAMVGHGDSVVRIGGFTAMNEEGDEQDLQSQGSVSRYDVATRTWKELTALPEPRSSHAAAVIGNDVYVVGGWSMAGESETKWLGTAWTADLSKEPLQWKAMSSPTFRRRALSVAAHQGRIYAVGGMDQDSGPSTRVDVYDPKSAQWTQGPALVGEPMTGFGCWAQSLGGRLYVSTISGNIQRLSEDEQAWEIVGHYEPARFFHCMLPLTEKSMVMVGGANMSIGRFTNLDKVEIE